jgi:hypothetical protein
MTEEHATLLLGAYALDALDPAERRDVARHLRQCPACVGELGELEPLPPLLAKLDLADVATLDGASTVRPSADLFARLSAAAIDATETQPGKAAVRARARNSRRPRLMMAAAAIVVLTGVGVGVGVTRAGSGDQGSSTYSASAGAVHMTVDVSSARTGTTLQVSVAGLPINEHCTLIAVASDGSRHPAGEWVATYAGKATVTGSTDVARARLQQLVLLGTDGRTLVSVTV